MQVTKKLISVINDGLPIILVPNKVNETFIRLLSLIIQNIVL